tara:strand:+ start:30399 stop:31283 length:885 start_codon:yes stop_codon:yes gene_type:complete
MSKGNLLRFGVASMSGRLEKVGVRKPSAILEADPHEWHYTRTLDSEKLLTQFFSFVDLLERSDVEIFWFDDEFDQLADSIFAYDPSFMTPDGAIMLRPGKVKRRGEVEVHRRFYDRLGIPIIGEINGDGTVEGGDCFWIDDSTLAVGRGFRSNGNGVNQLSDILSNFNIDVLQFDLPISEDPDACLHLMSVVSPLDHDLALVYEPLLPDGIHGVLVDFGYELLSAPHDEFASSLGLSLNVLAVSERNVIAIEGFEKTQALMREAGCVVSTFAGDELCIPCEGGPTCLTRPILRN